MSRRRQKEELQAQIADLQAQLDDLTKDDPPDLLLLPEKDQRLMVQLTVSEWWRLQVQNGVAQRLHRTWTTEEVAGHFGKSVPAWRARCRKDPGLLRCMTPLAVRGSRKRPEMRWDMLKLQAYLAELAREQQGRAK